MIKKINPLKKLNLGCKKDIREGYINLDILPFKGVNVQHDLNKFPYPFEDNYFDEIICKHVLEQTDDWKKVIKELYRISKNKAKWSIEVPYYNSVIAFNPHNKHFFTPSSFNIYDKKRIDLFGKPLEKPFYEIKNIKLIPSFLGRFVPPRLRNFMGMMIGNLVMWITFEIEVIGSRR